MACNKNAFRQVCDKPCASRIVMAEWSPLRDLIAVITSNGEVRLHRLYWQKVWVIPSKDSHATCLAWKYNGKILAVGYESGCVLLIEIEKATVIYTINCESKITSLQWSVQKKEGLSMVYKDCSGEFLPDIDKEDLKKKFQKFEILTCDKQYSVLSIGNADGGLHLYVNGTFLLLKLTSEKYPLPYKSMSVVTSNLSLETGNVSIILKGVLESSDNSAEYIYLYCFESQLLGVRGAELLKFSMMFTKVMNLIYLCENLLKQMRDASEDIRMKINSKLEKLDNLVSPNGSNVATEFTIAYATGFASPELQTFLTQHLTTKGLKQIAQSVQAGYSSLHNNIKDELELLTQHLLFHLTELQGMSKWFEKFGILGLSAITVQQCLIYLTQFIMKTHEFLMVISDDMNNFKIFFNWLANLVIQESSESTHATYKQLSNQDYDIMLDFLEHRLVKVDESMGTGYDLERVSQYFESGKLVKSRNYDSDWYNFVQNNESLKNSSLIITPDYTSTLVELFTWFKNEINAIFESVNNALSESLSVSLSCNLFMQADNHDESCCSKFSFKDKESSMLLTVLPCSCDTDKMFLFDISNEGRINVASLFVSLTKQSSFNTSTEIERYQYTVRDVKFYNDEVLTLLFEEEDKSDDRVVTIFGQLPLQEILKVPFAATVPNMIKGILDEDVGSTTDISSMFAEQRIMEAFRGKSIIVNGYSREVSCIVSLSGRRVRVFDMTAEDDDLDDSKMDDDSKLADSSINESTLHD